MEASLYRGVKADRITIVDYGMGNLWSVLHALRFLGEEPVVSGDPDVVASASSLILPGVGSFRRAMESLSNSGMDEAIRHAVLSKEATLLGICLGMQLLGSRGTEDGETEGLAFIKQEVAAFLPEELSGRKAPHIGFNHVTPDPESRLFKGLPDGADFYFVHSYRMLPEISGATVSRCSYGVEFAAAVEAANVYGVQFHPEKSQTNGLVLLKNFIEL